MCMMALGIVASIAQAAVGFAAAQEQADEQNAYYERNRVAAIAAANDRYASLNNKTLQEQQSASQELIQKRIEALKQRATAAVASGEAGVTGLSVAALQSDYLAQAARQEEAIQTNAAIRRQHNADEGVSTHHQTIGRINSVRQAASPSPLGFMVQALGGVAGAFGKGGGVGIPA